MNDKIINFFRQEVPVYQRNTKAFWDDEHISKGMLAAHLDTNNDGASRKLSTIQESVDWICEQYLNSNCNQLLDLGCGVGIYSELLHDKGFSVTGIDFSKRSIEYAKAHARKSNREITYHYQNYLDINYENQFDIAILVYCDFGVLSPCDRNILLAKIHKALKNNGVLILDVFNKPYLNVFNETQSVKFEQSGFWSSKPHVVIQRNQFYNETNNILERYLIITEEDCECFNIWNQIYSDETFTKEISMQGFKLLSLYDNICGKMFTGKEETICGVFQKTEK
ncbi:SAM-dependent methyltransferase [Drancourtella sp. An177]|nr:SAM-dependent methyltransferase [Drancourtella sp. An177]